MNYLVVALIVIAGTIFVSLKYKSKALTNGKTVGSNSKQDDTIPKAQGKDNPYEGLRNMALAVTKEQLNLTFSSDERKVFGIVMDWDVGGGVATLISYSTGDASLYLSTGGGLIGGGHHEKVATASKAFIDKSQEYLDYTTKADKTPMPEKGCVRFYLLTNKGTFTAQERLENFENKSSKWLLFFEEGNKVVSELRELQENK